MEEVLRDIARKGKPRPWVVFAEYGSVRASSGENPVSAVITPNCAGPRTPTPMAASSGSCGTVCRI
ncbi:hypothetical protein SHKM778_49750 [Streptomyces sp. KM77-8]|uniref:Uncharacterized protein n=1 Tax=Streptomyces haneummycinicus TaxID=3074435 RepID=A0AAT9HMB6_9ACTN